MKFTITNDDDDDAFNVTHVISSHFPPYSPRRFHPVAAVTFRYARIVAAAFYSLHGSDDYTLQRKRFSWFERVHHFYAGALNVFFGEFSGCFVLDELKIQEMRLFPFSSCIDESRAGKTDVENNQVMLFLNVYDLTPANKYLYWFGLGFYHSGIEVHGLEYAFGADVEPTSGVFEVEPRHCPEYVFRRSILLGSTDMSRSEICSFMELIADQYQGNTYNLIYKNCNHFTDEVSHCLTGNRIPGWVNRLARIGSVIESVLPESAQTTPLRQLTESQTYSGK
ncbi:hypothetical protein SASPL_112685 [Salvia splendens]|uniref:PPPDE domain-containing protein n=1 Tax=Salvia splendens TaxID=180675 RepID=A0A8X8YB74_SALSN|nr:hypothetical protein SASPL_112685 [Salvia splendens]